MFYAIIPLKNSARYFGKRTNMLKFQVARLLYFSRGLGSKVALSAKYLTVGVLKWYMKIIYHWPLLTFFSFEAVVFGGHLNVSFSFRVLPEILNKNSSKRITRRT